MIIVGGNRRLNNPDDFVRTEIAAALQRDIPVAPILLDDGSGPKSEQLPSDLKELPGRMALKVHHASFDGDIAMLIRGLRAQPYRPSPTDGSKSAKSLFFPVRDWDPNIREGLAWVLSLF
jgi:hypothetical protein